MRRGCKSVPEVSGTLQPPSASASGLDSEHFREVKSVAFTKGRSSWRPSFFGEAGPLRKQRVVQSIAPCRSLEASA